jgi:hypothetical protein
MAASARAEWSSNISRISKIPAKLAVKPAIHKKRTGFRSRRPAIDQPNISL